ncbi:hypothetical protein BDV23DRAFT_187004 [Aspergillus alliaceus]|uniref:F-box domain-containing protein n=1 Tax=Petromyces alliaceus TaxID=209559 RepID=A0A5N7BXZ5_PETAA|nr:hypothetical protein BDV23DRAFT_187004 [Aspergillus alliaceus]
MASFTPRKNENGRLSILPEELVEQIASLLDPRGLSLCNMRLTCVHLYNKTLHRFGCTVLHTIRTDLNAYGLQRLVELADDSRLRDYVHVLFIAQLPTVQMGTGLAWTRDDSGVMNVGQQLGARWLRRALLSMVNCKSFVVQLNYAWERAKDLPFGPTDSITIILSIIAEAGIAVKSFSVFSQPGMNIFAFNNVDGRRLHLPLLEEPAFIKAWAHIEKLRFDHNLIPDKVAQWVVKLIALAPNLKSLEIGFDYSVKAQLLMARLATDPGSELRELRFINAVEMKCDHLLTFLRFSRRTLRSLKLEHLQLVNGSWIDLLDELPQFSLLDDLTLSWLSTGPKTILHFPSLENPLAETAEAANFKLGSRRFRGFRKNMSVSYHGPSMALVLDALLETSLED